MLNKFILLRTLCFILLFIPSISLLAQRYKVFRSSDCSDGCLGIYDKQQKKYVTKFIYSSIDIQHDKFFVVQSNPKTRAVALLDESCNILIPEGKFGEIQVDEHGTFATVSAVDANPDDNNKPKYGIYDVRQKKMLLQPKYSYLGKLNKNGIAAFNKGGKDMMPSLVQGGKWGYVNKDGVELCSATYTWCSTLNDNNYGTAYIGGNSNDGLYGGIWTVVDASGKNLLDNSKYVYPEKDPYNEPPGNYVLLSSAANSASYKGDNILASCDGKFIKQFNSNIIQIDETNKLVYVSELAQETDQATRKIGIHDFNDVEIVPFKYSSIKQFGDKTILLDENENMFEFDIKSKTINALNFKFEKTIQNSLNDKYSSRSIWVIIVNQPNGLKSILDCNLKTIATDVDSINDLHFGGSTGNYLYFHSNSEVNFLSPSYEKLVSKNSFQAMTENYPELIKSGWHPSKIMVKRNNKWGAVETLSLKGENFIYDSLYFISDYFAFGKKEGKWYFLNDGKEYEGFVFDAILDFKSSIQSEIGKSGYYTTNEFVLATRQQKKFIIKCNHYVHFGDSYISNIVDSGSIQKIEPHYYIKNNVAFLYWGKTPLPKGTTEVTELNSWIANSDSYYYAFKCNNLWGITNDDGKVIESPKYKSYSDIPEKVK